LLLKANLLWGFPLGYLIIKRANSPSLLRIHNGKLGIVFPRLARKNKKGVPTRTGTPLNLKFQSAFPPEN
jgi:hypothetical protein